MTTTVIKIGGSLFDLPDLRERLVQLLALVPGRRLLVGGGGRLADVVRDWDRVHRLGEEAAHTIAMRTLTVSGHFLQSLLPGSVLRDDATSANRHWEQCPDGLVIANVPTWLAAAPEVVRSWDTTTDSLAAWIAREWPGSRLLLVKSCARPETDAAGAARLGIVDRQFPITARGLAIDWCDLRSAADLTKVEPWLPAAASISPDRNACTQPVS